MPIKYFLLALLSCSCVNSGAQSNKPMDALNAYLGTWVIFNDKDRHDTLCITVCTWSSDHKQLKAGQVIHGRQGISRDSCFYGYDTVKRVYTYYETDETGKNVTSTSDIVINKKTWVYSHHSDKATQWRTLNTFNLRGDEITYDTQRSDDGGKTWTTVRTGKEYKVR